MKLVLSDLEDDVELKLKELAEAEKTSVENVAHALLRSLVTGGPKPLGSRIAERFRGRGFDGPIDELRGESPTAADFGG